MLSMLSALSFGFLAVHAVSSVNQAQQHPEVSYPLALTESPSPTPGSRASTEYPASPQSYATYMRELVEVRRLSWNDTADNSTWIVVYDGGYKFNPDWYAAIFVPSGVLLLILLWVLFCQTRCCSKKSEKKDAVSSTDVELAPSAPSAPSAPAADAADDAEHVKDAWVQPPTGTAAAPVAPDTKKKTAGLATRTYVNTKRLVTCA